MIFSNGYYEHHILSFSKHFEISCRNARVQEFFWKMNLWPAKFLSFSSGGRFDDNMFYQYDNSIVGVWRTSYLKKWTLSCRMKAFYWLRTYDAIYYSILECVHHCNDVIGSEMVSQITSLTIVYSTVYSWRRSKKTPKLLVTGLCGGKSPVNGESLTQRAINAQMFPFDDFIMILYHTTWCLSTAPGRISFDTWHTFHPKRI